MTDYSVYAGDIEQVLNKYPLLGASGFKYYDKVYYKTKERHEEVFVRDREYMKSSDALVQFAAARRWLRKQTKGVQRLANSYGLKHRAERAEGTYIPNGVFIAAAVAEGFKITKPDGPNVRINVLMGNLSKVY